MSVNLKGADKEPPTEEIYITETLQAPQAENTEPVTKTEQEAKLEHDLNYTYPYNTMSADWGSEVYEDGFRYYEIQQTNRESLYRALLFKCLDRRYYYDRERNQIKGC